MKYPSLPCQFELQKKKASHSVLDMGGASVCYATVTPLWFRNSSTDKAEQAEAFL